MSFQKRALALSISANWYKLDGGLKLQPIHEGNFFIDIIKYIATSSMPPDSMRTENNDYSKSYRVCGDITEVKATLLKLLN